MSISEIIVKIIGVVLAIFGLMLIFQSATALPGSWILVVVGLVCLAGGIYIVRGGNFTA
jgi:hypothetical protein